MAAVGAAIDGRRVDDAPKDDGDADATESATPASAFNARTNSVQLAAFTATWAVPSQPGQVGPVPDGPNANAGSEKTEESMGATDALAAAIMAAVSTPPPAPVGPGDRTGGSPVVSQADADEAGQSDEAAPAIAVDPRGTFAGTTAGSGAGSPGAKGRLEAVVAQALAATDMARTPTAALIEASIVERVAENGVPRTPAAQPVTLLDVLRARAAVAAVSGVVADVAQAHAGDAPEANVDAAALRAYVTAGRSEVSGEVSTSVAAFVTESAAKAGTPGRDAGLAFGFEGAFTGHKGETVLAPAVSTNFSATLASASDAATTLPTDTVNQIVQAIRLQWSNGSSEARITLQPDQFGDVTVSVRVERGQVVARVEADAPVVREWLQNNQVTLRQGLAEHNLTLDRLEVAKPPESRDADRRGDRQAPDEQPHRRPPQRPRSDEDAFEVVA